MDMTNDLGHVPESWTPLLDHPLPCLSIPVKSEERMGFSLGCPEIPPGYAGYELPTFMSALLVYSRVSLCGETCNGMAAVEA